MSADGHHTAAEPRNFKSPFAAANPCLLPPAARHDRAPGRPKSGASGRAMPLGGAQKRSSFDNPPAL
jgi:hypothetical protein